MRYSDWLHNTRKHFLLEAIAAAHGNQIAAAANLGIHRNRLYRLMKADGIKHSDIRAIREAQPIVPETRNLATPTRSIYRTIRTENHAQG